MRRIRGYAIISKGEQIDKIDDDAFLVPSQNGNKKYRISVSKNEWTCTCPDFEKRKLPCKHIFAIQLYQNIKDKIKAETFTKKIDYSVKICTYCKSDKIVKNGYRKTTIGKRQIYICRKCGRKFVFDVIKKHKGNGKIITLVLDLWFKGVSIRKITEHLQQFYNFKIGKSTIQRWISKFTILLNKYVETLEPELSGTTHIDEQMIKSKGKYVYCWNAIDNKTRYLLASNVTEGRSVQDAKQVLKQIKDKEPKTIITDRLMSYRPAIRKTFGFDVKHIANPSIRNIHSSNNIIERYHNSFRERDKIIRGFKSNQTAQTLINGYRLYYNFIRNHQGLGTTPSNKAGLWNLEGNKWLELMQLAQDKAKPEKESNIILKISDKKRTWQMDFKDEKQMNKWINFHKRYYPDWEFEVKE